MTPTTKTEHSQPVAAKTDLRELFPALHLLRASGLAIDPRKMFLGGLALVLLVVGNWQFAILPFAPSENSVYVTIGDEPSVITRLLGCVGFAVRPRLESWLSWDAAAFALLTPIRSLIEPAQVIFQANQSWSNLAFAWTQLLWSLIVWSFIGGALCRMNALQFASRKRIKLGTAFRFSRRQLLSYLAAPILPLSAVLILQGFNWLLGCLAALVPAVGGIVLGVAWGIVLFTGFLMAMLTLGLAIGWPLMIAAISAEDSDGFDGLSRAFGYLFDRPWHAGLFATSSLSVFAVSRVLIAILVGLAISLGTDAVSRGENDLETGASEFLYFVRLEMFERPPRTFHLPASPAGVVSHKLEETLTGTQQLTWPDTFPGIARFSWTLIPALLYVGFGPSFFWSATTVSYFLLRQSDDGTSLDSVVDWSETVESEAPTEMATAPNETPPTTGAT